MKKAIGYRIRKLRENRDYSQENMGVELGITAGAYAKIERGETDPSATRLLRIAEILGVDVYTFFHDTQLKATVSRVEEIQPPYGPASRTDIEEFTELLKKVNLEIEKIKIELARLKKEPAKKK